MGNFVVFQFGIAERRTEKEHIEMKNQLRYFSLVLGLALGTSMGAYANTLPPAPQGPPPPHTAPSPVLGPTRGPAPLGPTAKPQTAPEIDLGLAMGGLTMLAGTLTVLRARRKK